MGLECCRQGVKFESEANSDFQIDLEGVKTKSDRRTVATLAEKLICLGEPIKIGCLEVRQGRPERREPDRHYPISGRRVCQSVARSKTRAVRSRFSSAKAGARSCMPIGRPDFVRPQGTLRPGMPARLVVMV
jgi:hypothetical protein